MKCKKKAYLVSSNQLISNTETKTTNFKRFIELFMKYLLGRPRNLYNAKGNGWDSYIIIDILKLV